MRKLQFFIDPALWSALQERFQATHADTTDVLRDIHDGLQYKRHKEFFASSCNVSFLLNTDGVALYHSSKVSVWPVWLAINELPAVLRYYCF